MATDVIYNDILGINEDDIWNETDIKVLIKWRYELQKQLQAIGQTILRAKEDERDNIDDGYFHGIRDLRGKETVQRLQQTLCRCVEARIEQLREEKLEQGY